MSAALRLSAEVENAVIVCIVCDRGDRYLSTGIPFFQKPFLVLASLGTLGDLPGPRKHQQLALMTSCWGNASQVRDCVHRGPSIWCFLLYTCLCLA